MIITQVVWRTGGDTMVVTIPRRIRDALKLKHGDYVELDVKKIDVQENPNYKVVQRKKLITSKDVKDDIIDFNPELHVPKPKTKKRFLFLNKRKEVNKNG